MFALVVRTLMLQIQNTLLVCCVLSLESRVRNPVNLLPRIEIALRIFRFNAAIGHETLQRLRIDARQVPCIGVAIGIAILNVKQQNEIVTTIYNGSGERLM